MSYKTSFGKQVAIERYKIGLTQQDISDKTGIGVKMIDKIERGNHQDLSYSMYIMLRRCFEHSFTVQLK